MNEFFSGKQTKSEKSALNNRLESLNNVSEST